MFTNLSALAEVFYNVPIWEQILRLFLATLLGAVFGIERELKNKPAGFITFMLVSLGSCVFALLQINMIKMKVSINDPGVTTDVTRLIAQVIPGIGFLGAGTILHNRGNVKGITTAALIWVSAAVGLCVGIGGAYNYIIALVTSLIIFPITLIIRVLGRRFADRKKTHRILIVFEEDYEEELSKTIVDEGGNIKKTFFHNKTIEENKSYKEVFYYINMQRKASYQNLVDSLASLGYVLELEEM